MSCARLAAWTVPAVVLGLVLPGGAFAAPPDAPRRERGDTAKVLSSMTPKKGAHADGITRCALCHSPTGWQNATFDHARTGFPLEGKHARAPCQGCHSSDYRAPVPTTCAGCHRDAHAGDFGQRCEGCHTPSTWRTDFTADSHRRTAFPLVGRHAFLPCTECHAQARDRRFSRQAVDCVACHQREYEATRGTAFDHPAWGFGTDCRSCHGPWRFRGATFPQHDACFLITAGPHAGLGCLECHTSLQVNAQPGTCRTNTASCTGCHEHRCEKMAEKHREVLGYQCQDRRCYECHQFAAEAR